MNATDKAAFQTDEGAPVEVMLGDFAPNERISLLASLEGDISSILSESQLVQIGAECIEGYDRDLQDRSDWEDTVKEAFKRAAQEKLEEKLWPWKGASNVNYPLLTTAALQFAARAYPAIVKGDEAVSIKVIGKDNGMPVMGPNGPMMQVQGNPVVMAPEGAFMQTPVGIFPVPEGAQPEPMWQRPPGAKSARANRVRDYMNNVLFYEMEGWEEDTDSLLHQLPIAGCAFRKTWVSGGKNYSSVVPALRLVAPMSAKNCKTAPRLTEIREEESMNDIIGKQRSGFYRTVELVADEDEVAPRKILEQHCLIDLDEDGYAEPYIVTLDHQSSHVLRIEPNFAPESVEMNEAGEVTSITAGQFFTKYDFFPNMEGKFYGIGLGHLLEQIGDVVNRSINQMIDAGAAATAGGGFIGSGVNLQGAGQRSGSLYFEPGEYKTVNVSGSKLREGIYERTFPGPSQIMFNVLELMLGAAQDISSVKDVLTGEASNNGQVGTTLALIEQGLQVFTAIYKRVFRSLKADFTLLFDNISTYGGEDAARDYMELLDDPAADFIADFDEKGMDIRPISDPASVTKMQKMARANFLMGFLDAPDVDAKKIIQRAWEAADVEDIDDLWREQAPQQPNPRDLAAAEKDMSAAYLNKAKADAIPVDSETDRLKAIAENYRIGAE